MMEAGLVLRAEAELTGEAESVLMLLLEGCEHEDDGDGGNDDWGRGTFAALG